ncbi:MAG: hypothetical protein R3F60_25610 [bacterium]
MIAVALWFGVLLAIGALALLAGGLRQLGRGLRHPDHPDAPLWLVRGLREVLLVICGAVIGVGAWLGSEAVWMLGLLLLAEELYETGVVVLLLERQNETVS